MNSLLLAVYTLWQREIVRFYRQRSRVIGAIGSPLVFWILIGSGIGKSFQSGGSSKLSYSQYFFPGTILLVLLFTAIFSSISLIEDRKEGFLQAVLVAPVPRVAIALGKIMGSTTLAVMQGMIFLLLAPLLSIHMPAAGWAAAFLFMLINAFVLSALGFAMAWHFQSVQGFHAVMNLVLFPMWILSGALFPASGAAGWIQWVMRFNPLAYGMDGLRGAVLSEPVSAIMPFLIMISAGAVLLTACVVMVNQKSEKNFS